MITASNISGTNTGDVTLTPVGSSPNANGASLSGQVLTLQPADGTNPGLLTAGAQSIGGAKTFTGAISASNLSGTNTGDVTLGTANGLSLIGQVLSLGLSSTSTTGALSSTDWNTFNNGVANAANRALSNLASVAINTSLLPASPNTINLGSAGLTFAGGFFAATLRAPTLIMNNGAQTLVTIDSNPVPLPSTISVPSIYNPNGPSGLAGSRDFGVFTQNGNSGNPTGSIHIESGNNTNAGGITGDIALRIGTTAGTRGKIIFQDGSEGTSGYVWTSTNTTGSGAWMATGGTLPPPLEALASYTSNFIGLPSTFLGNDSDNDQTNKAIVLGSTDTAVAGNFTSSVFILGGDNTAASSTADAGRIQLQAGSISSGVGSAGSLNLFAGNADSSNGGGVAIQAGSSVSGPGGFLSIDGGAANSGTQDGGDIQISGGTSSGGIGGDVVLVGGSGPTNGNISLQVSTGASIQLQDTSVGTAGYVWTSTDTVGSGTWLPASSTPSLANNHIFVGNGSNVATDVAMSGDVSIINTGATTIANSAITNAKVSATAAIAFSKLATLTSAHILVGNGSNVATDVAMSGAISITNAGVTSLIATTNSTLTTLTALSLPGSQVTGNISGNAANVTGTVAIGNGGTGQTTANAGFNALSPMTTAGDIIYENNTPVAARLPIGSNGQILTVSSGLPSWQTSANVFVASESWITDSDTAPNSYGTTNTFVRRFLTTTVNTGSDITYTNDASLGSYWTVNSSGNYSISYVDVFTGDAYMAIVRNGTQGSTGIQSITTATEAVSITSSGAGNDFHSTSVTLALTSGDVIWMQTSGAAVSGTASLRAFSGVRVIRIS